MTLASPKTGPEMIQQNGRKIVQIGPIAVEIHVKSNASALEFNPPS